MKMIFTDSSVVPCDMVKGLLDSNGIRSMIKNEHGSTPAGDPVPFMPSLAYAWPEVWVNDGDFARASDLIKDMTLPQEPDALPWKCPHCGEVVDSEFDACWNCSATREEQES